MTKAEDIVYKRRIAKFIEDDCDPIEAEDLACTLMIRDREGFDDRRICFECKNYKDKLCTVYLDEKGKPTQQLRFTLQRCPRFNLKGSK
jgi:hypothetical protein